MTIDLQIQRERATELAEVLADFINDDLTVDTDGMLDALACCGLVLQKGEDAGLAYIDGIMKEVQR